MSFGLEVALADGVNQVNANSRPLVVKYEATHNLSAAAYTDISVPGAVVGDTVCIQAQIYVTSPSQLWRGGNNAAYQDDSIARAYVTSGGSVRVHHPVGWYLTDMFGGNRSNSSTLFKIVVLG